MVIKLKVLKIKNLELNKDWNENSFYESFLWLKPKTTTTSFRTRLV